MTRLQRLARRLGSIDAWVRATAFRKLFATSVAISLVLGSVMMGTGYLIARRTIRESVLAELEARTEAAALRIELTAGGVANGARGLARNGIVTNALVDAEGRDLVVRPLLRDFAEAAPVPVSLTIVDFQGRGLCGDRPGTPEGVAGAPWLRSVIEQGEVAVSASVRPGEEGPLVVYAYPVLYPGTDRPEGALVAQIALRPVLEESTMSDPQQVVALLDPDAPAVPLGEETIDDAFLVAERPLTLAGKTHLRLRLAVPHAIAFRGLHRFAGWTTLGVAAMFVVVFGVLWQLSTRLTAGIRALSANVVGASLAERADVRVPRTGEDEIGALSAAFNVLLGRLQSVSEARLAEQVERAQGAERALRLAYQVVEQAAEAIEVVDAGGKVVFSNAAAARLRAGAIGDEPPRQRWEALFRKSPEWWRETWDRLREFRSAELSLRVGRSAETIPVAVSLVHLELDGEEHCIATIRDVRDRLRAEATERLASLGTLAAGVAHEINNPLAYVLGNLSFVSESLESGAFAGLGEDERSALGEAIHGAERVRDVVRSLRAYSRPGEGPPARIDVAEELRHALRLVGNTIQHRARVVEEIDAAPMVLARANELGQVFVNLLVNAGQAARAGASGGAEIGVRCYTAQDGRAAVEVADNGVGIPAELQGRVFEPFFTTKAVGEGTGLGLSICHGIVTRLGGTIGFESEPGVGTRFTVLLPPADVSKEAEEDAEVALPRGRILVVDDDPAVTRALARMLGRSAKVAIETGAEQALARLLGEPHPDAILCDVMMPGLSGPDFHQRLRTIDPALARRVVFITGGAVTEAIAAAVAATGQPCVEKPPERAALARAIASVQPT
ncbi:MAG TPA: ATP-binding protein [Anaeromyxobacteraceae bacterium]|nr:ATP-binding protein [Anaeromyxobacteraceae bacterium]